MTERIGVECIGLYPDEQTSYGYAFGNERWLEYRRGERWAFVDSWEEADALLRHWSEEAPKAGGFIKCDYVVRFTDDTGFGGRIDLVHPDVRSLPKLKNHTARHCLFYSGQDGPEYIRHEEYEAFVAMIHQRTPGLKERLRELLDRYDI